MSRALTFAGTMAVAFICGFLLLLPAPDLGRLMLSVLQ